MAEAPFRKPAEAGWEKWGGFGDFLPPSQPIPNSETRMANSESDDLQTSGWKRIRVEFGVWNLFIAFLSLL